MSKRHALTGGKLRVLDQVSAERLGGLTLFLEVPC